MPWWTSTFDFQLACICCLQHTIETVNGNSSRSKKKEGHHLRRSSWRIDDNKGKREKISFSVEHSPHAPIEMQPVQDHGQVILGATNWTLLLRASPTASSSCPGKETCGCCDTRTLNGLSTTDKSASCVFLNFTLVNANDNWGHQRSTSMGPWPRHSFLCQEQQTKIDVRRLTRLR